MSAFEEKIAESVLKQPIMGLSQTPAVSPNTEGATLIGILRLMYGDIQDIKDVVEGLS